MVLDAEQHTERARVSEDQKRPVPVCASSRTICGDYGSFC